MTELAAAPLIEPVDQDTFEQVFKVHFKALHSYAYAILKDMDMAEEIVQTVFLKLWEKKETIRINTSLKAYLFKTVYYDSLNHLKHEKVKMKHWDHIHYELKQGAAQESGEPLIGQEKELQQRLDQALNLLPEKCRMVFQLSRFEELKYREIADRLNISIKTVEAHMGKALKTLRAELAEFLPLLLLFLTSL